MPIYEYICKDCQNEFEELVFSHQDNIPCPRCGCANTEKLMSACSAKVEGGGPNLDALRDSGGGCGSGG